jgi:hypothetical protein
MGKAGPWNIDAWAVSPDLDNFGFFDNAPDRKTTFWGIYSTRPLHPSVSVDFYYLARSQTSYLQSRHG